MARTLTRDDLREMVKRAKAKKAKKKKKIIFDEEKIKEFQKAYKGRNQ